MTSAFSCVICHECDQRLRFFHVPSDAERLNEWSGKLNFEIKTSAIVCEKHFLEEHFTKNRELNCWRINSKAIPTLHLTGEEDEDIKLINEIDFDTKSSEKYKERFQNLQERAIIDCLWCDERFDTPDLSDILKHLKSKHHYEVLTYFELEKDENHEDLSRSTSQDYDFDDNLPEDTIESEGLVKDDIEIEEECYDYEEINIETDAMNEESSMQQSENAYKSENDDENTPKFEFEDCNLEDEFAANAKADVKSDINIDEIFKEPLNINMETTDPSTIFCIIDLLKSIPQIWFINYYKSKEYEAGLKDFCQQFSQYFQISITETELHESLIEIRDWYIKIYETKSFDQLKYPQNEYFSKLTEFLPDKPNGKTCELCGLLFHDHIQYFGHKRLLHPADLADDDEENNEPVGELPTDYLKKHSRDYFYARYPLRQGGFSYQCQNCPTKTDGRTGKKSFFEHIKTHLDVRDYVCDLCGKSFVKYRLFEVHKNRHFGVHKFPCKICGKEFTNGSLLTAHRKRYHRPIEGTIEEIVGMSKRTIRVQGIAVSIEKDGSRLYTCTICGKKYKGSSSIYVHRGRAHPELEKRKRRKNLNLKHNYDSFEEEN